MFSKILGWLKSAGEHLFHAIGQAAEETAEKAAPAFEALIAKYLPRAVEHVIAALNNPGLLSGAEKRSEVLAKLKMDFETDGHSIEADGIENAGRLLTEMAVATVKLSTGGALKAPGT